MSPPFERPLADAPRTSLHDLELERALLGALLLDPVQLDEVQKLVTVEDLYDPIHQQLYAAMVKVEDHASINVAVIKAKLSEAGALAPATAERLRAVEESALSSAGAAELGKTVAEKGARRRVVEFAKKLQDMAVAADLGTAQLFDAAEALAFQTTERSSRTEPRTLESILGDTLPIIQRMAQNHSPVTGLATGIFDLDEKTTGFHPGELFILAARPGVGKTSLAMNMALHAAVRAAPARTVAVFSLEMPCTQLAFRMLCSEARISQTKLRTGRLSDYDLQLIAQHAGALWSAPVFVDDSGGLSIIELRSKTRRIVQQVERLGWPPLGLVVVDYLQLMRSGTKVESRQLEISEISRGLKSLSKELGLPVLALSQLSRDVEKGKRKPQLADLRECVTGDTLVLLADGGRVPIRDLVGTTPELLAMADGGKIGPARSDKVWKVGKRQVLRVSLASGRQITATAKHRLFSHDGWRRVADLAPGDRLALARHVTAQARDEWPDDHVALLGHLIGDGSFLVQQPMRYSTASEENSELVTRAARSFPGVEVKRYAGRGLWHQLLIRGNGNRWHPAGVNAWLRGLGIFGQRSHEKRIPAAAFLLSDRQVGLLLQHLWATDGTIVAKKPGQRSANAVAFSTSSPGLATDVMALLLRLGIVARRVMLKQGRYRPVHQVSVSGADAQRRFLELVGAFGPRVPQAARLRAALEGLEANTNVDTLPHEVFGEVRALMAARGVTTRQMAALRGTSYGGTSHFRFAPSRQMVLGYAELLGSPELAAQATNDLFWDRVVSIVPAGEEEVFDLTVPGPACWLADGIVSHNSGAIEQDADCVMFIHKDPESVPKGGIGGPIDVELIIAKQRNGPTGEIDLLFMSEYTRFENVARDSGGPQQ